MTMTNSKNTTNNNKASNGRIASSDRKSPKRNDRGQGRFKGQPNSGTRTIKARSDGLSDSTDPVEQIQKIIESLSPAQTRRLVRLFVDVAVKNGENWWDSTPWTENELSKLDSNLERFVELFQIMLLRPRPRSHFNKGLAFLINLVNRKTLKRPTLRARAGDEYHCFWQSRTQSRCDEYEGKIRMLTEELKSRNASPRNGVRDKAWLEQFVTGESCGKIAANAGLVAKEKHIQTSVNNLAKRLGFTTAEAARGKYEEILRKKQEDRIAAGDRTSEV